MVKLKDVAKDLGVSVSTVSEVLNQKWKKRQISEKLAKKILRYAKKLNYQPNLLGRQFRLQKTSTIGVVLADLTKPHSSSILSGLEAVFSQYDYATIIFHSLQDYSKELKWLRNMLSRKVDGIILEPTSTKNILLKEIKNQGIPIVLVDTKLKGTKLDFVVTDNFWGTYEGVKFLIKKGHRKIAYLGLIKEKVSLYERFQGYKKALFDSGVAVKSNLIAEVEKVNGSLDYYSKMKYLLSLKERPTAIFIDSFTYTNRAFKAIKEKGLIIPDDLLICGFDPVSLTFGEIQQLELDSFLRGTPFIIEQSGYEIGQKAAIILLDRIKEKEKGVKSDLKQISIKPKLKIGRRRKW